MNNYRDNVKYWGTGSHLYIERENVAHDIAYFFLNPSQLCNTWTPKEDVLYAAIDVNHLYTVFFPLPLPPPNTNLAICVFSLYFFSTENA